jgi:hypothetical protein
VIDSNAKRKEGLCPLTPEEIAMVLKALDIDPSYQIYIAAGEIYGGQRRMAALTSAYPNVVRSTSSRQYCILIISFVSKMNSLLVMIR